MPLARIDLPAGKPTTYSVAIVETVQSAMHMVLNVPVEERFQVVTEHPPDSLSINPAYLGIARSPDAIIIQVTLNAGRDADTEQRFYRVLADRLRDRVGLRREDVLINLVEVSRENWSFGNGEARSSTAGPGPWPLLRAP